MTSTSIMTKVTAESESYLMKMAKLKIVSSNINRVIFK